jgi:hypothetical protein
MFRGNASNPGGDAGSGGMQQKAPAMINTTSATSKIIHPPEDISLVSGHLDLQLVYAALYQFLPFIHSLH